LLHALPAWKLAGDTQPSLPQREPSFGLWRTGKVGYHLRRGEHGIGLEDWEAFMDFAEQVFSTA